MKKYLNLKTRTYKSKEYDAYLNSLDESEDYDEADAWKKDIREDKEAPIAKLANLRVDPDQIVAMIENCSLEAFTENPDDPRYDSVDVYLASGLMVTVTGTIKEIEKQMEKLFSKA